MRHFLLRMVAILAAILIATPPALAASPSATSVTYGPASATRPGIVTTGTQSYAGNKTFLGTVSITDVITASSTLTVNKTQEAGAETVLSAGVSDAAGMGWFWENFTGTGSALAPTQRMVATSTFGNYHVFQGTTDSGSTAVGVTRWRIGASTAVSTRPFHDFQKADGTSVLQFLPLNSGANLAMSWGSQTGGSPSAFGTRPIGNRLILASTWNGTDTMDHAIGYSSNVVFASLGKATSAYIYRVWGGTQLAWQVNGAGAVNEFGAKLIKTRTALTTPVTVDANTDHHILTNLTTPGAVAVNLPSATGNAGLTYIIQDAKGDAGANNITITPAAGTINGAATLVISTNYGAKVLTTDGTNWFAR